jgi:hypothetical protein
MRIKNRILNGGDIVEAARAHSSEWRGNGLPFAGVADRPG